MTTDGDLCYAKFVFRDSRVAMEDAFVKHCHRPGLANQSIER